MREYFINLLYFSKGEKMNLDTMKSNLKKIEEDESNNHS